MGAVSLNRPAMIDHRVTGYLHPESEVDPNPENCIGRNICKPAWQPDRGGYAVEADLVADSSPCLTGRLKRFGRYDLNRDSLNLAKA
jgi:hypothetical protein